MRENCTSRLCYAMASQAGSMSGSRRKTAKSFLMLAEGRAGVPDSKRYAALLYTPWTARKMTNRHGGCPHNIRPEDCTG